MIYDERPDLSKQEAALLRFGDVVSTTHFRMSALLQVIHADVHLAPSARGILRNLIAKGPMTVPELAALRPSSRQFIQKIADPLIEAGLIETQDNPRHKRSKLLAITEEGKARVSEMIARERRFLADALSASGAAVTDVAAATQLLETLIAHMDTLLEANPKEDAPK